MEDESCTGVMELALIATPLSTGAIDHELATVQGLALAEAEIAGGCGGP